MFKTNGFWQTTGTAFCIFTSLLVTAGAFAQEPGETFQDCPVCPVMVVVPAGDFTMGSPEDERHRRDNEDSQHPVSIADSFAVGIYEVTFNEWDACVAEGECGEYSPEDVEWGRDTRPVIEVNWHDTSLYVDWLSRKTGKEYRLLTEAEWEYAARGGTSTPYFWGEEISGENARYDSGSMMLKMLGFGTNTDGTVPVGSYEPNGYGIYDMHGNVWEWVEDCYNETYAGAPTDGSAWLSGNCKSRVLRGGSWIDEPGILRSAHRSKRNTRLRFIDHGFRIARTLEP